MSDDTEDAQEQLDDLFEDLRLDAYCPCDECRKADQAQLQKLRGQIGSKTEVL